MTDEFQIGHTCHARNCKRKCPPTHLMCARHWRMVPPRNKREVLMHYRPGQCDDKRPSRAWFEAANAAIAAVAAIDPHAREAEDGDEKQLSCEVDGVTLLGWKVDDNGEAWWVWAEDEADAMVIAAEAGMGSVEAYEAEFKATIADSMDVEPLTGLMARRTTFHDDDGSTRSLLEEMRVNPMRGMIATTLV